MFNDDGLNEIKNDTVNHGESVGVKSDGGMGNGKYPSSKIWWIVVLVAIVGMAVMIIFSQLSGVSKGDSVQKNATTEILSNGMEETMDTIVASKSPVSTNEKEESICASLDDHMPLLQSILRGDEIQADEERSAVLITRNSGCLMPFAAQQRVLDVSTRNDAGTPKRLIIPGFDQKLIRRAFVGKRIYFVGDSTMRVLFVALRKLLIAMNDDGESVKSLYNGWIRDISEELRKSKQQWRKEGLPPFTINGTYLEIVDVNPLYFEAERRNRKNGTVVNGTTVPNLQKDFLGRLQKTLDKPDIIIFNAGMHLLHLTPMRALKHQTYVCWVHYESLLEKLLQLGLDSGASALIAKSTNKICNERLPTDMKKFAKSYHRKEASLKACLDFVELQEKEERQGTPDEDFEVLSQSQREEICNLGILDESGSSYLNERMSKWAQEQQMEKPKELVLNNDDKRDSESTTDIRHIRTRLQYFNDHDVESCEFTDDQDGRHYPRLSLVRLHLLAILLDCMLPK